MLADTEINIKILGGIAAAIYGVYTWWQESKKKKEAEELEKRIRENGQRGGGQSAQPSSEATLRPPSQSAPARGAGEISEQERLRKFLEALGVPSGAPPQPQPRPVQPPPQPVSRPVLVPQPAPMRPVYQPPAPVLTRPVVPPARLVPPPKPRESLAPGMGGPLDEVEEKVVEFRKAASVMVPMSDPEVVAPRRAAVTMPADLREVMRSRETLRAAIVAREILGPPPGL